MSERHLEFFGPDLARGPFASHRVETAAVQIATALAQLRAPLARSDDDLRSHVDFIRELADRLAPDWAAQISMDVGDESANVIDTLIRVESSTYTLLRCWLADAKGGGETSTAPTSVTWNTGTVPQTVTADKQYLILTPTTGVVSVSVEYSGNRSWYWAAARHGRVYYSSALDFDT